MKRNKFSDYDLTTEEGRIQAMTDINTQCHRDFQTSFAEISSHALFDVGHNSIIISLKEVNPESSYFGMGAFGSQITLYDSYNNSWISKEAEMSFGSMGCFNPKSSPASYWRTLHAACILKKWDLAERYIHIYCNDYKDLIKAIDKANPINK